jgi:hypothetical protein
MQDREKCVQLLGDVAPGQIIHAEYPPYCSAARLRRPQRNSSYF